MFVDGRQVDIFVFIEYDYTMSSACLKRETIMMDSSHDIETTTKCEYIYSTFINCGFFLATSNLIPIIWFYWYRQITSRIYNENHIIFTLGMV